MRTLLIFITATATWSLTGCSSLADPTRLIPDALDRASLVYRPTVQQGSVVTQEQVNQLKPGMSRRQERFVLGSPTLQDVFHENRWDYPYSIRNGGELLSSSHVTVFFDGDSLVNVTGDILPEWAGGPAPG